MADSNEPKKETTRIVLSPPPAGKPPDPSIKSRDTVRIQLPSREPLGKPPLPTSIEPQPTTKPAGQDVAATQFFQPPPPLSPPSPPKPPAVSVPLPASVTPAPDSPSSGPRKETVRIPLTSDPSSRSLPTVQMKKTQPLIAMPVGAPQSPSIAVASAEKNPMPLLWVLLGVSAVILIIQIWTYLS
jgi:hypothetical protein